MTTKKPLILKDGLLKMKLAQLDLTRTIKEAFPIGSVIFAHEKVLQVVGHSGYGSPGVIAKDSSGKDHRVYASDIRELPL